ncbi:phage capsid protein [Pimelobacter simplex]|uniref:Uncharacterized protein n=1 Tax=Nocardioides simplex TaxID=2045 RepID=A0A0A1DKU6_NOCSI|nr:hypothetical protein [Pimelobacter simplex]AIY17996.1 hypothetical protein KR76_16740 [Pimelobacter simplex]MCG8152566.1 phage capsid protein [Pimelobacter simplex]GEB17058.1 hypothetical protein NSI01_53730 [Pimelobacter simplex]SFM76916.1 hypothetical protein SAMN05421671_3433 [Pimelobacter simplex]
MPVSLAQAKLNTTDDVDLFVINEFLKQSWLVGNLPFHDAVNGAGAGGTLTYGYNRQITQATAGFRAINSEYTPQEVTKQRFSTDLKPLGGSFQIDRVLDKVAAAAETEFQMKNKIEGAVAAFNDAIINGDTAVDANGFDGLSKALTGSSTELGAAAGTDWTTVAAGNDTAFAAIDVVDELLAMLNGPATALLGNTKLLTKLRGIARRASMYVSDPVIIDEGPEGTIRVEKFGNVWIVDMGTKAGTNTDVIPVTAKTVGGQAGNYTDLYAVRLGMQGFHGVSLAGQPLINTWLPDFTTAGAVKTGEVELGPVSVALKATKAAAVRRNIRLS